jgi:hypothetical protein
LWQLVCSLALGVAASSSEKLGGFFLPEHDLIIMLINPTQALNPLPSLLNLHTRPTIMEIKA